MMDFTKLLDRARAIIGEHGHATRKYRHDRVCADATMVVDVEAIAPLLRHKDDYYGFWDVDSIFTDLPKAGKVRIPAQLVVDLAEHEQRRQIEPPFTVVSGRCPVCEMEYALQLWVDNFARRISNRLIICPVCETPHRVVDARREGLCARISTRPLAFHDRAARVKDDVIGIVGDCPECGRQEVKTRKMRVDLPPLTGRLTTIWNNFRCRQCVKEGVPTSLAIDSVEEQRGNWYFVQWRRISSVSQDLNVAF